MPPAAILLGSLRVYMGDLAFRHQMLIYVFDVLSVAKPQILDRKKFKGRTRQAKDIPLSERMPVVCRNLPIALF